MRRWQTFLFRIHVSILASILPDGTKIIPLKTLLGWFTPNKSSRLYAGLSTETIREAITRRLVRPLRMRGRPCLRSGLLTFYFLRLVDQPAILNFAVFVKSNAQHQAHCWVTLHDEEMTPPPEQESVMILRHPIDAAAT